MLTITLPFPAPELMPNRSKGKHWGQTFAIKDKSRNDAHVLTVDAVRHHMGHWPKTDGSVKVPVTLTFHAPDKRHRDLDNLLASMKAALDGVAAALLMDDREFEPVTLRRGELRKTGAVVVEIGAA